MKPKKITRTTLAAEAAQRWDNQYGTGAASDKQAISRWLHRLGAAPSPDDVDKAIGNKSWTSVPACDSCCQEGLEAVVEVGQTPDYDSATARLCEDCILAAAALFQDAST